MIEYGKIWWVCLNMMDYDGILWNMVGYDGIIWWNILDYGGLWSNLMEYYGTWWWNMVKYDGYVRIWQNMMGEHVSGKLRSLLLPESPTESLRWAAVLGWLPDQIQMFVQRGGPSALVQRGQNDAGSRISAVRSFFFLSLFFSCGGCASALRFGGCVCFWLLCTTFINFIYSQEGSFNFILLVNRTSVQ